MQEANIDQKDLETWADILLDHSLGGITSEDRVMLKGERITWPLLEVLERKIIQAGAIPDVFLVPPNNERGRLWSSQMAQYGTEEQLYSNPAWFEKRYRYMTKYIEVLGAEDPKKYAGLNATQTAALASSDRVLSNIRLAKPWALTLYPTPGFAAMERMAMDEYVEFIVKASTTDPRMLKTAEERIAPLFDQAQTMVVITQHPKGGRQLQLEMSLASGRAMMSYGLHNFPDGEVFTSPDANTPNGEIYFDLPVHYGGVDIQGIYLKLEAGQICDYNAEQGHEQLAAIIETDNGSKRMGEIALGMNPNMDKVLKHPLFVEKVGGTLHMAIGASYENCFEEKPNSKTGQQRIMQLEKAGILNRSAQHVDIVADFRPGGCGQQVFIDGQQLMVKDNIWLPGK